jgi:hypothetical protein
LKEHEAQTQKYRNINGPDKDQAQPVNSLSETWIDDETVNGLSPSITGRRSGVTLGGDQSYTSIRSVPTSTTHPGRALSMAHFLFFFVFVFFVFVFLFILFPFYTKSKKFKFENSLNSEIVQI